jgi:hypothetical protein
VCQSSGSRATVYKKHTPNIWLYVIILLYYILYTYTVIIYRYICIILQYYIVYILYSVEVSIICKVAVIVRTPVTNTRPDSSYTYILYIYIYRATRTSHTMYTHIVLIGVTMCILYNIILCPSVHSSRTRVSGECPRRTSCLHIIIYLKTKKKWWSAPGGTIRTRSLCYFIQRSVFLWAFICV